MNKIQNHTKDYKKLLKRLEHYGIYYSLNFLFGLEDDHPEIFEDTLNSCTRSRRRRRSSIRDAAQGHSDARSARGEARNYPGRRHVHEQLPLHVRAEEPSPQQVEEGVWRCTKEFYSFKSMFKRLLMPPGKFTWQA